jgi:hypothetical protein
MATPAAATPKEQGRRPDPFTKREDYELFKRQLLTFFIANDAIYDTELKKILFTLSYMTEGTPGAWAQYQIEQAQAQATAGTIPNNAWGDWATFQTDLNTAFADPNKARNALNEMESITYRPKEPMTEFFQRLDILATRAGYIANDNYMIGFLEPRIPAYYVDYVYQIRPIPTTYVNYKERVLEKDNLVRRRQAVSTGHRVHLGVPPRSGGTQKTGSGVTYGGYGQPMDIGRQKTNRKIWTDKPPYRPQNKSFGSSTKPPPKDLTKYQCYGCGKYGHLRTDCPVAKNKSPNP